MGDVDLRLARRRTGTPAGSFRPIGEILVDCGKIAPDDLRHALKLQAHIDAPLGDVMVAEGLAKRADVLTALALQAGTGATHPAPQTPPGDIANRLPVELCLTYGVVPWREDANTLYIAAASPRDFKRLRQELGPNVGQIHPVIVEERQIQERQSRLYGLQLAQMAETRVAEPESCRTMQTTGWRRAVLAAVFCPLIVTAVTTAPYWTFTVGVLLAAATLVMTTGLKAATLLSGLRKPDRKHIAPKPFRMPRVSVLVPLLREREIAGQLISRLSQLTYPKSLLDVVLVLEEGDSTTRDTIDRTSLPDWMSVVEVPRTGPLTTKPRALNYALNFCKGSIIGVWDAEDWPEADQIEKVVTRFSQAPDNVVCLQGVLDYYNSRSNWLTRCFTIEYAIWWRIVMPGIARLGLVVPLGGTTLFFKRSALEQLGGWDAHNVTEDADLGVRLARHGFVTELLPTVTREEATSRGWSWVRQRSRWLKGFLVTYLVHMRAPGVLLNDLGLFRFLGLQTQLLASVLQFAAAPLLWSFWLTLFGVAHPIEATLGSHVLWCLVGLFVAAEVLNLVMGWIAVNARDRRHLWPFVPTMICYFALGTLAAYKALWELIRFPFFWDKTQHGVSRMTDAAPRTKTTLL